MMSKKSISGLLVFLLCAGGGAAILALREPPAKSALKVEPPSSRSARERRPAEPAKWKDLTDDSLPRDARLNLANEIQAGLSAPELDYLFTALRHQPQAGEEEKWWVVLNEIMERMRISGVGAERYSEVLGSLIADRNQPPVVRDYAIQHLAQWIGPAASGDISPGEQDPAKKRRALDQIAAAVRDPSSARTSIPGTGLMALVDLSPRIEKQAADKIWNDLRPFLGALISGDGEGGRASRITAIQAVGIRKEVSHLPAIRSMAGDESIDASIRLSAIASLGLYADPSDRALLLSIQNAGGKYQYAASSALKNFPLPSL